jgi:hypothetical protein
LGKDLWASVGTALLLVGAVALPFWALSGLLGAELVRPLGLGLALLALPILLLHVLKSRRPRHTVASLLLWRSVVREQEATSPFKRLRRRLPLLLQLSALACLAYGLAGPTIRAAVSDEASRVAIVIDVSASMLTRDAEGRTRFEAAREQAAALVAGLGPDDQGMLVAVSRRPWIVVPWTDDRAALRRGLDGLHVRHEAGRLDQALVLVASSSPGARLDEVHVYSDGGGPPLGELDLSGALHYHPQGAGTDNVGITAVELRARTGPAEELAGQAGGLAYQVFANVLNASQSPRQVFVALERSGKLLAARRLELPSDAARPVVLEARLTPGPLAVRLLPALDRQTGLDPFDVDDTAWLLVPEEVGAPVGLVSAEDSPALRRALEATGARLEEGATSSALPLVVCEQTLPDPLPPGDCLLVAPPGDVGPIGLGEEIVGPRVAGWDRSDPLLAWVDLQDVEIERCRRLELGPGARALLQGEDPLSGEPVVLIASYSERGSRRVVVGFDVYRSSWPLRASFPIFMRNCVEQASASDAFAAGAWATGSPVLLPAAAGQTEVEVQRPDGGRLRVVANEGRASFGDTGLAGIYYLLGGDAARPFCVNLVAPAETRVATREQLQLGEVAVAPTHTETERPLEISWVFALLALVALVVEAWAYHRRW